MDIQFQTSKPAPRKPRVFGLKEAPTFYPSKEQFLLPMTYIRSIQEEAEKYGICKIVPPKDFKPPFSIDFKEFKFQTRYQKLNAMDGSNRNSLNYHERLEMFFQQQNIDFAVPILDKKPLNLMRLRNLVKRQGGPESVTVKKQWAEIGRELGIETLRYTGISSNLKHLYLKWIHPYELYLQSNGKMYSESDHFTDQYDSDGETIKADANSMRPRRELKETPLPALQMKRMNSSPKKSLPKKNRPNGLELCKECTGGAVDGEIVICDECESAYHLNCVNLTQAPKFEWYCYSCIKDHGNDFGFEDRQGLRNLPEFQKFADSFKKNWFRKQGRQHIDENDCEKEFWRLTSSFFETLDVEYGADLHTSIHGSGFPTTKTHPDDPYSKHPWNLNNFSVDSESLLRYIKTDISGMMVPWLYIGMVFSTFCWHVEDHFMSSINYHHWGETKTWYGIPSHDADKFEAAMKATVPELFESNPDLLFHLTTIFSPGLLTSKDVSVYVLDQRPGDIIVTFPRAYHSGFNHGLNCCEAVNFALVDWIEFGEQSIEFYSDFKKSPVFCHEELIVTTLKKEQSTYSARFLRDAGERLLNLELARREKILEDGIISTDGEPVSSADEKDQCSVCKAFCFFSRLTCANHKDKISCLRHAPTMMCDCDVSCKTLVTTFNMDDMAMEIDRLTKFLNEGVNWVKILEPACNANSSMSLKDYLKISRTIRGTDPDVENDLARFIQECRDWVNEAGNLFKQSKRKTRNDSSDQSRPVKLSQLTKLIERGERLPFSAPEMNFLKRKFEDYTAIDQKAKKYLMDSKVDTEQVKLLLERSSLVGIEIPSISELSKVHQNDVWIQKYGDMEDFSTFSLEDLYKIEQTISKASPSHPLLATIQRDLRKGEEWQGMVNDMMANPNTPINDIERLLRESKNYSVSVEIVSKLKSLIREYQRFEKHLEEFNERKAEENMSLEDLAVSLADDMDYIEYLHLSGKKFRTTVAGMSKFMDAYMDCSNWKKRVSKLFSGKYPMDISLNDWIFDFERIVNACMEKRSFSCFCFSDSSVGLEACIICKQFYHRVCVKLPLNSVDPILCPCCDVKPNYTPYAKPTLGELLYLVVQAPTLIRLPEVSRLAGLVLKVSQWLTNVEKTVTEGNLSKTEAEDLLKKLYSLCVSCKETNMVENYILKKFVQTESFDCACDENKDVKVYCRVCRAMYSLPCAQLHTDMPRRIICEQCGEVTAVCINPSDHRDQRESVTEPVLVAPIPKPISAIENFNVNYEPKNDKPDFLPKISIAPKRRLGHHPEDDRMKQKRPFAHAFHDYSHSFDNSNSTMSHEHSQSQTVEDGSDRPSLKRILVSKTFNDGGDSRQTISRQSQYSEPALGDRSNSAQSHLSVHRPFSADPHISGPRVADPRSSGHMVSDQHSYSQSSQATDQRAADPRVLGPRVADSRQRVPDSHRSGQRVDQVTPIQRLERPVYRYPQQSHQAPSPHPSRSVPNQPSHNASKSRNPNEANYGREEYKGYYYATPPYPGYPPPDYYRSQPYYYGNPAYQGHQRPADPSYNQPRPPYDPNYYHHVPYPYYHMPKPPHPDSKQ